MFNNLRELTIDLKNIGSVQELHLKFKTELGFPDFYGMNWNAFWDAITEMVEMPEELVLKNFRSLEFVIPSDAEKLRELITEFNHLGLNSEIAIHNDHY